MHVYNAEELLADVESLPTDLKTKLIEKLLISLNPSKESIEDLWKKEVDRRMVEIESEEVELIEGEEVFRKIRHRFVK
ncbi:addiction module protein [Nitratifractor sp.]|uniref:addiction module protein n=1 Tax=Nitratifractor sp. TaxID=2268144 RepID=UPI0025F6F243|nr:addiction module protein [Nitratifractor sp.]